MAGSSACILLHKALSQPKMRFPLEFEDLSNKPPKTSKDGMEFHSQRRHGHSRSWLPYVRYVLQIAG